MRYFVPFIIIIIGAGCSTDPTSPDFDNGTFQHEETVSGPVYSLNLAKDFLLAGTTKGAFKKSIGPADGWQSIGLKIPDSKVVDFVSWDDSQIIAVVKYDSVRQQKPTLFESSNGGSSWNAINVEKPEGYQYFVVHYLEQNPNDPKNIFAYAGRILESNDGGQSWSIAYEEGGVSEFLTISKFHPSQIWTGGSYEIPYPYLTKSQNSGQSWILLSKSFRFDTQAAVKDAILHPQQSSQILVGAGGSVSPANVIRKSTDGGQSWQTVLPNINGISLTHSARNPTTVYASGRNGNGRLFFADSQDFGDSWQQVEWQDSPTEVQINDMVSVMENGQEVLYFATTKGIFSYTFKK